MLNTPDLRDRIPQGAGKYAAGVYIEAGLPNITGRLDTDGMSSTGGNGAFYTYFLPNEGTLGESSYYSIDGFGFDASRCSSIYGKSDTVQPEALAVNFYIKAK
ncbi:MAG: hypothetical protein K5986_09960 [Clostridium sp.]|nr:hypothetical protein [Clostridium sp.]